MNTALRAALEHWPRRDEHPALLVALGEGDVSSRTAADQLIAGLARPHTTEQSALALIEMGEYALAEEVIERLDAAKQPRLTTMLAHQRAVWEREAESRLVALGAQAEQAGCNAPATLPDEVFTRRVEGIDILNRLEREIGEAALSRRADLERRRAACESLGAHEAAFVRCMETGQLEVAHFLLDAAAGAPTSATSPDTSWPGRVGGSLLSEPAAIPSPPAWPWNASAGEVLTWLEPDRPAPFGFRGTFAPSSDDELSIALVSALATATPGPLDDDVRAALDRFIGVEPREGVLASLDDPLLGPIPALRATAPIVLDIESPGQSQAQDALVLRASDLLSMLREPSLRRVTLLRILGQQVPLDRAVDPDSTVRLEAPDAPALSTYVAWLLDLLGLIVEPAVPEVLAWLAAGDESLALVLLRETVERSSGIERRVQRGHVLAASESPAFVGAIRAHLGVVLDVRGAGEIARAIRWLEPSHDGAVSQTDILEACALRGTTQSNATLERAIAALCDHFSFLERREGGYGLTARGRVLARHLEDE